MPNLVPIPLDDYISRFGIETATIILDSFACARNRDIEDFVRHKAIEFSRQGIAKTQLVFTQGHDGKPVLVGIFALALKIVRLEQGIDVSARLFRRITRSATEVGTGIFDLASPLLAQFAKNDAIPASLDIDGSALLETALGAVKEAQAILGGRTVYLECADEPSLVAFYEASGFNRIHTPAPNGLVRMIRYLAA